MYTRERASTGICRNANSLDRPASVASLPSRLASADGMDASRVRCVASRASHTASHVLAGPGVRHLPPGHSSSSRSEVR